MSTNNRDFSNLSSHNQCLSYNMAAVPQSTLTWLWNVLTKVFTFWTSYSNNNLTSPRTIMTPNRPTVIPIAHTMMSLERWRNTLPLDLGQTYTVSEQLQKFLVFLPTK